MGSEKRYHNWKIERIFEEIKYTESNSFLDLIDKKENFRAFAKDSPDEAFKVLALFQDNNINSVPYWEVFIYEASRMTDSEQSKKYFLKSFEKVKHFNNEFIKKCLGSLTYSLNCKFGLIYSKDKEQFKKWWKRLFELSKDMNPPIKDYSDIESIAENSNLGNLSQTVFSILWSGFIDEKIPKDGKIPTEVKEYFEIILYSNIIKKNPSVLFYFGSNLSRLWYLDREWTIKNLKPLMDWNKTESFFVRNITNSHTHSFQPNSNTDEGAQDTLEDYNICKPLWKGYLFRDRLLDSDFLEDFKEEFFNLLLNYKKILTGDYKIEYTKYLAEIFFIATGGKQIKNIFTNKETQKIVQKIDTDILSSLSSDIWQLLKDTEKDKSSVLWSEKIKPWIERCWPQQQNKMNQEIAENLSLVILHCGNKLLEAFNVLKNQIKEVIDIQL